MNIDRFIKFNKCYYDLNFKTSFKKILFILFFIFIFFPYINIFNLLKTDTQPNALIISLIINFLFYPYLTKINKKFIFLLIPFMFGLFLFPFSVDFVYGLREIGGYLSVLSISISIYIYFKKYKEMINIEKFIIFSFFIWLIFGILQKFFYSQMNFLLPRLSTSVTRGSTSLAPEPSYYGLMLMFYFWLNIEFLKEKKKKLIIFLLILIQLLFIAKSGIYFITLIFTINLYFIIYLLFFILDKFKIKYSNMILFIFLVIIGIFIILISFFLLKNTRLYDVSTKLIENPIEFFKKDKSANERITDIIFSIKGFVENFGLPHFLGEWKYYISYRNHGYQLEFFNFIYKIENIRIKSLWGSVLFNLGFIGFLYIYLFNYLLLLRYKNIKIFLFFFIFFNLIFISQVPMAHPFVGFLYGYLIYKIERESCINEKITSNII